MMLAFNALQFLNRWVREGQPHVPIMVCASLKVPPATTPTAGGALDA
jgi:hypothetical protein